MLTKKAAAERTAQPSLVRRPGALTPAMIPERRYREAEIAQASWDRAKYLAIHHLRDAVRGSVIEQIAWFRDLLVRHSRLCEESQQIRGQKNQRAYVRRKTFPYYIWRSWAIRFRRTCIAGRLMPGLAGAQKVQPSLDAFRYQERVKGLLRDISVIEAERKLLFLRQRVLTPLDELLAPVLNDIEQLVRDLLNEIEYCETPPEAGP